MSGNPIIPSKFDILMVAIKDLKLMSLINWFGSKFYCEKGDDLKPNEDFKIPPPPRLSHTYRVRWSKRAREALWLAHKNNPPAPRNLTKLSTSTSPLTLVKIFNLLNHFSDYYKQRWAKFCSWCFTSIWTFTWSIWCWPFQV